MGSKDLIASRRRYQGGRIALSHACARWTGSQNNALDVLEDPGAVPSWLDFMTDGVAADRIRRNRSCATDRASRPTR
jgi:hypothetical protein